MPRQQANRTDEWITPPEIVALVLQQFGAIDLDPCAHTESPASKAAATTFDIRKGEDGLTLPWPDKARVYCNPPYARFQVEKWAAKCAAHAAAGGEVLLLINAQVGSRYFREKIWPVVGAACFLCPRVKFLLDGVGKPSDNTMDSALLYYGPHVDRFISTWSARGTVVRVAAVQGADKAKPANDATPIAERASGVLRDLVTAAKARHVELYNQLSPLRAAVDAAKAEHGQYSLDVMEAERAVSLTLQEAITAVREASRIEGAVQAFERALNPVSVPVALPYREREAAKLAARNSAKRARAEMIAKHRDAKEAVEQENAA